MMIELMVRWTEMRIKPTDQNEAQLKKLIEGEPQPEFTPEFFYEFSPMVFEMSDVARFNRSHDKKSTTLRMKDGEGFVVNLSYEEFKALYTECTGHAIVVVKDAQGGNNIDTTPGVSEFDVDSI